MYFFNVILSFGCITHGSVPPPFVFRVGVRYLPSFVYIKCVLIGGFRDSESWGANEVKPRPSRISHDQARVRVESHYLLTVNLWVWLWEVRFINFTRSFSLIKREKTCGFLTVGGSFHKLYELLFANLECDIVYLNADAFALTISHLFYFPSLMWKAV